MAGLVPGHSKPGEQVDEARRLEVERAAAVRLARRAQARERARRVRRRPGRARLPRRRRVDRRLHRRPAPARRAAGDRARRRLRPAARSACRDDPRVTVLERTNARALTELPFAPQLVTCDVSFISVKTALPPALALAAPGWQALVLVKPQFEAGRADAPKGVVRDPEVRRRVLREVAEASLGWSARVAGVVDSGLPGPKGNHEFVLHLVHAEQPRAPRRARPLDRRCRRLSASRSSRTAARRTSARRVDRLRAAAGAPASSCCSTRTRPRSTASSRRDGPAGPRGRARRRRHDAARRSTRFLEHGRAGARRELRPRRLPHDDAGRRARAGPRAGLRRRLPRARAADARGGAERRDAHRGQRRGRRGRHARPHDRARVVDRRRGARRAAVRRPDLRDADRARPPTTSRTAARCSSGASTRWCVTFVAPHSLHARPLVVGRDTDLVVTNRSPDIDGGRARRRPPHRQLPPASGADAPRPARSSSRRCPSRRSSAATATSSAPPDAAPRLARAGPLAKVAKLAQLTFGGIVIAEGRRERPRPEWRFGADRQPGRRRAATAAERATRPCPNGQSKQSAAGRTIDACCAASGSRTSCSSARPSSRFDAGLNAITGETGAGQDDPLERDRPAARRARRRGAIGAAGGEAYVEAEFDLPDADALGALAELRPEGEEALVVARRIFADGRTRAYAWGRSAAREDVAAAVEGAARDERPVRAAAARAAALPARRARLVRRHGRHGARGAARLARARLARGASTTS